MYYKSNTAALGLGENSPVLAGCHTSAEGSCLMPVMIWSQMKSAFRYY